MAPVRKHKTTPDRPVQSVKPGEPDDAAAARQRARERAGEDEYPRKSGAPKRQEA